ncbi:MAG: 3-isopropylmalate dehydratase small subunit [Rhodospirillaceae bacterium]|jgi:3-isopropylmalate/(R)-2-methylmalate dehydratase small subunit
MEAFTTLTGIAAPIDIPNVDTNQICPTEFNKVPVGDPFYPKILFHYLRFNADGTEIPEFILNKEPFRNAKIIVADRNWGGGSSRESAVYAIMSFGARAVIASSFGDIHYNNCLQNGVLPVKLKQEEVVKLRQQLHENPGAELTIDLEYQTVRGPDNHVYKFDVNPVSKRCLLNGLDAVARTQEFQSDIDSFKKKHHESAAFLDQPGAE